jgi:glycerol kinase
MENQHRQITGYRELTQEEINQMNLVKSVASTVEQLAQGLKKNPALDQRWVSIGVTHMQEGFMAWVRSIAKPTTF